MERSVQGTAGDKAVPEGAWGVSEVRSHVQHGFTTM